VNPVQRQIDLLLAHRAAEWMESLKTGGEQERREFDAWLRQSPLHVTHFLEVVALGQEIRALGPGVGGDVRAILQRIEPGVRPLGQTPGKRESGGALRSRRKWMSLAAAAGLAGLVVALAWNLRPGQPHRINTTVGEQRSLTLADGSLITLNTASEVRVSYSDTERSIDLEAGEAVFRVAPDRKRPFEVQTRLATIRALGTQFNIYQRPEDILVSVLDGKVAVSDRITGSVVTLGAGEQARIPVHGRIEKRERADLTWTLAWQQRRLSFEEAPIEEMVREFNRYNSKVRFRIEGLTPGTYHFGGIFDAYDTESFAALLAREPGLRVEKREHEIIVRPAG
jgi:transmembrane sensor